MKKATLDQGKKILRMFENTSQEQVQAVIESGLLADIRDANLTSIADKRDDIRRILELESPFFGISKVVIIPAQEQFIVREKFVKNINGMEFFERQTKNRTDDANPKILYLSDNFEEWFKEKIEDPIPETKLSHARVLHGSGDGLIIKHLGDKKETRLAQIFGLMERQSNGEKGILLTNGRMNVFYVNDTSGTLRVVYVGWHGFGWRVTAEVVGLHNWDFCHLIFSSN